MGKKSEVASVPIASIKVGDRFRKELGAIDELKDSIRANGLIHPIAVLDEGLGQYLLLAGGRRLKACQELGYPAILVRKYFELNPLQERTIELVENIHRQNMTFVEESELIAEIHELQQQIHGKKMGRTVQDDKGWGQKETAELVGLSRTAVTKKLQMAKALEKIPELKGAKTESDANKLISKLQKVHDTKVAVAATERVQGDSSATQKAKKELGRSYRIVDFLEGIKEFPDKSFDIVEVDPPYSIELDKIKKGFTGEYQDKDKEGYMWFMTEVLKEIDRVTKPTSWLIMWHAPFPWAPFFMEEIPKHDFRLTAKAAVWVKERGQTRVPQFHLASTYESFFYARKMNAQIIGQGHPDVFRTPMIDPDKKVHPTERPIELIQEVLITFGRRGDMVLVPFAGSGNTMLAANNLHMNSVGFDIVESYKDDFLLKIHAGQIHNFNSLKEK